ncbi:hypothetical protein TCAL_15914 [Tigriopus californicus]|uniref:Neuropeptide F n=1 Tax=Tigriopus californicus TaxID=6832 RepID=A0A553PH21_TIGCA|nr:hypothetical protein TCAL_15914 [Tigriopus californicus]
MIRNLWILFGLALVAVFCFLSETAQARPSAGEAFDQEDEMSDALKYLEELDKHYAKLARPRQRRVGQNMASALEKLSQIKNYYNEAGRPSYDIDLTAPASYEFKSSSGMQSSPDGSASGRLGAAVKSFRNRHPSLSKEVADSAMVLLSPLFRPSRRSAGGDPRGSGEVQRRGLDKVKALQMIDSDLAHMSRPRFGKRSGMSEPLMSMYDRYDK